MDASAARSSSCSALLCLAASLSISSPATFSLSASSSLSTSLAAPCASPSAEESSATRFLSSSRSAPTSASWLPSAPALASSSPRLAASSLSIWHSEDRAAISALILASCSPASSVSAAAFFSLSPSSSLAASSSALREKTSLSRDVLRSSDVLATALRDALASSSSASRSALDLVQGFGLRIEDEEYRVKGFRLGVWGLGSGPRPRPQSHAQSWPCSTRDRMAGMAFLLQWRISTASGTAAAAVISVIHLCARGDPEWRQIGSQYSRTWKRGQGDWEPK